MKRNRGCKNRPGDNIKKNCNYHIKGFNCKNHSYRRKLISLGFLRGENFQVINEAPMGDPVEIKINGCRISVRKEEIKELILEKINKEKYNE